MVTVPLGQAFEGTLYEGGSFVGELAKGVGTLVCELYRDYPGWVVPGLIPGGEPSPIGRGIMNSLCSNSPSALPPAPTVPFNGGQCECVVYDADVTWTDSISGVTNTFEAAATAPVNYFVADDPNSADPQNQNVFERSAICSAGQVTGTLVRQIAGGAGNATINSVALARRDGQPDTCGNPPPRYPDDTLIPPGVDTNPDGDIVWSPPPGTITIPTEDGLDITVPVFVFQPQFNPDFNIRVNLGGIPVTIDLGGINIDNRRFNPPEPGSDPTLPPLLPPRPPDVGDPDLCPDPCPEVDLTEINDKLDAIKGDTESLIECLGCGLTCSASDYDIDVGAVGTGEIRVANADISYVRIVLTRKPADRYVYGGANVPKIMLCGWLSAWCLDAPLPREPIQYEEALFRMPKGTRKFSYELTRGARGYAVLYTPKES